MTNSADPTGYRSLGLARNPFIPIPPVEQYSERFRQLFTARSREVDQICRLAGGARALFVIAPYGGGKTVVLLEALSRLREAGARTVYTTFSRRKGFCGVLLEAFASAGHSITSSSGDESRTLLRSTVRTMCAGGQAVVVAVDDLDRATDVAEVFEVTHDVRELLAEGIGVVVTGQPFGVTFDLHTSAGGLFNEVMIPEFTAGEFMEMLGRYLRSAHLQDVPSELHPFDQQGAQFICVEMADAKMTPRLFNFAVSELLDSAAASSSRAIPLPLVLEHWPKIAQRTVRGLTALQQRHLEIMFKEPMISEDTPHAIAALGGNRLAEYPEVAATVLRPLVEKNLVYVTKVDGKDQFRLTTHTAAAVGLELERKLTHEQRDQLVKQWKSCRDETDHHQKGHCLEEFVSAFLGTVPGFSIPEDGVRLQTETEELDIVVEIVGSQHHVQYGVLTICECKNWATKAPGDVLAHLRDKLSARGCKFGIFVAPGDVMPGLRAKMKAYLQEGIVIALLTAAEFDRLEVGAEPALILRDSYYATVKYRGEE